MSIRQDAIDKRATSTEGRAERPRHHRSSRAFAEKMLKLAQLSGEPLTDAQKSFIYVHLPESRESLGL